MTGITLDAGPLIALDKGGRQVIALLALAESSGSPVTIPATALAQATRNPARQARLSRLVRQPRVTVTPLDRRYAVVVGKILAASGTADIVDAHVVACAREARQPVATSDPSDLRQLDPALEIVPI